MEEGKVVVDSIPQTNQSESPRKKVLPEILDPTTTKIRIEAALENDNKAEGLDNLANLLLQVLTKTLPKTIDASSVAKDAAKKFIEEFSGQSGKP